MGTWSWAAHCSWSVQRKKHREGDEWHHMGRVRGRRKPRGLRVGSGAWADLFVVGLFTVAGTTNTNYIAKWDGASWSAVGSGMGNGAGGGGWVSNPPCSRAVTSSRVVCSERQAASANRMARAEMREAVLRWGLGTVSRGTGAIGVMQDGSLIVGGRFVTAGGAYRESNRSAAPIPGKRVGDGWYWSLVSRVHRTSVAAVKVLANGSVAVGG